MGRNHREPIMLGLELIGVREGLRGLGPWWTILSGLKSRPQQGLFFQNYYTLTKYAPISYIP